jgi:hypothetical protein
MPKPASEQPDSWRAFTKPRSQAQDPERNLDARAQAFLKRIAPLSADLAAHGRTRALALKKLRRICQAEVRRLKANYTPATVKFYLSKYRDSIRAVEPDHLVLRPRKERCAPASASAILRWSQKKPALLTRPTTSASTGTNPTSSLWIRRPSSKKALDLLASERYLEKGMGLMALTGRRPAEIFFSAKFSSGQMPACPSDNRTSFQWLPCKAPPPPGWSVALNT